MPKGKGYSNGRTKVRVKKTTVRPKPKTKVTVKKTKVRVRK